ncbi:MAG: ABC transporter ATP-binding protein [Deltaproteobacteria bacterium]|nr:ABC transporter ATP-binding protein [Deltaproteobacteria bacterium]
MAEALLEVKGLVKCFGAIMATARLNLSVMPGEVHAIIGPNGAGKSTLIAQIAGELRPDAGLIRFSGKEITTLAVHERSRLGLARSCQITSIFPGFSALDNVALAVQACCGHSFRFWKNARLISALREPALAILEQVGLSERAQTVAARLSYGEQRQLEIAMALAIKPKLLLLDEPMAGMGQEESEHLTALLMGLKGRQTLVLVEHDMEAVFALADRISVLVYGKMIATGTPDVIRSLPEVRKAYLGDEELEGA